MNMQDRIYHIGGFQLTFNPDGSFNRPTIPDPRVPPTGDQLPPGCSDPALSKDIPLNKSHNTFIRIFKPIATTTCTAKLPILLYIHGGGFIFLSASSLVFHKLCMQMAVELPMLVLSVEHRLAPEHRLPAAYDDATDALVWLRDQAHEPTDKWLDCADFSNCFIMGTSSGGNIAFHLAIRTMNMDLNPIKVSGLIMDQPGFSGEEWTESELRMANDKVLPLNELYSVYKLCAPEGANRDHEYINPIRMKGKLRGLPKCLINGYLGDPLIDRYRGLAEMLEEEGVSVVKKLDKEGIHGDPNPINGAAFFHDVKCFVYESLSSQL